MVMHVLPLGAFLANATIDIASYEGSTHRLRPMGASGWDSRINLDGLLTFTGGGQKTSRAYTQVFRTGVVESVCVLSTYEGRMNLPSVAYEEDVIQVLTNYFAFVDEFEIDPPYYVFLSFVGVRGCRFGVGREYWTSDDAQVLRQETMILPEVVIQNRDDQPHEVLRPVFDTVWNAFGFRRSDNYDEQGNWIGR